MSIWRTVPHKTTNTRACGGNFVCARLSLRNATAAGAATAAGTRGRHHGSHTKDVWQPLWQPLGLNTLCQCNIMKQHATDPDHLPSLPGLLTTMAVVFIHILVHMSPLRPTCMYCDKAARGTHRNSPTNFPTNCSHTHTHTHTLSRNT